MWGGWCAGTCERGPGEPPSGLLTCCTAALPVAAPQPNAGLRPPLTWQWWGRASRCWMPTWRSRCGLAGWLCGVSGVERESGKWVGMRLSSSRLYINALLVWTSAECYRLPSAHLSALLPTLHPPPAGARSRPQRQGGTQAAAEVRGGQGGALHAGWVAGLWRPMQRGVACSGCGVASCSCRCSQ